MLTAESLVTDVFAHFGIGVSPSVVAPTDDPVAWIETQFYVPELNGPIVLEPYHRAVLNEAYARDGDNYRYSIVVWSDVKKSIKSCIAAAVALERARRLFWGSVKIVANDLKGADSRVAFYARRAIELNSRYFSNWKIKPSGYQITTPQRTQIEAVPVDPKGEAGGTDDLIIFSELWGANQTAAIRMWTEMTLSPTKYGKSQRWVESYAGFSGESPLLEQLYETGVKQGRVLDLGIPGLEVYANDTARMLTLWNTFPRCEWQTNADGQAYYAQEAAVLPPNQFARVHRNQWTTSESAFIPPEWWTACQVSPLPAQDKYHEIVVGVDAAVSGDCFGIVAVSRSKDKVIQRYVRKWTPPKGGKLEYSNTEDPDDTEYPEGVLRWLAREYNVIAFGYDPYQLHHLCTTLENENVGFFRAFSQGADRLKADKQLRDVIRDRRFVHDGNPDLTEHVTNANAKTEGDKLRLVKRADHLKIDLAVCASMATDLAFELLPE